MTRDQRTEKICHLVNWILDNDPKSCRDWGAAWFEHLVNLEPKGLEAQSENYGQITNAYSQKKLSEKAMRLMLSESPEGLPPVDLPFPTP